MASNCRNKNTIKTVLNKLPQSSFMSWHAIFHRIGLGDCFTSAIKIVCAGWYLVFHIENSTFQDRLSTGTSCLQRPWTHYHWMIWVSSMDRTMLWANNCEFRVNFRQEVGLETSWGLFQAEISFNLTQFTFDRRFCFCLSWCATSP